MALQLKDSDFQSESSIKECPAEEIEYYVDDTYLSKNCWTGKKIRADGQVLEFFCLDGITFYSDGTDE
jgi:hypothetical protein